MKYKYPNDRDWHFVDPGTEVNGLIRRLERIMDDIEWVCDDWQIYHKQKDDSISNIKKTIEILKEK